MVTAPLLWLFVVPAVFALLRRRASAASQTGQQEWNGLQAKTPE